MDALEAAVEALGGSLVPTEDGVLLLWSPLAAKRLRMPTRTKYTDGIPAELAQRLIATSRR